MIMMDERVHAVFTVEDEEDEEDKERGKQNIRQYIRM